MEFCTPLKDITCDEFDEVLLECIISRENGNVKWLRDGEEISESHRLVKLQSFLLEHKMFLRKMTIVLLIPTIVT